MNLTTKQNVTSILKEINELLPQIVICLGSMNTSDKWYKELDEVCESMTQVQVTLRRGSN